MTEHNVRNSNGVEFPPTIPDLLRAAVASFAESDFLAVEGRRYSFAEADRVSGQWAKGLLALGVSKSSRVGILFPNNAEWVLSFLASARLGALCVPLSTFYQAPEMSWVLRHTDIDTLLVCTDYLSNDYIERLERALPGLASHTGPTLYLPTHPYLRRIIVWGDCDRKWALRGEEALISAAAAAPAINDEFLAQVESNICPADPLVVICTSGSTAEPKAVVHSQGTAVRAVHHFTHYIDVRPNDRLYTGQPLFWIGGLAMNLIPCMFMGACVCFPRTPGVGDVLDTLVRERVTRLSLWPAQIAALLERTRAKGIRLESVRTGLGAPVDETGTPIPKALRALGPLGMTESFGMHSIEKFTSAAPPGKAGNWGRHLPGVERRVVDVETGIEVPPGTIGELQVRGFTLMQGYYKREREDVFLPDGFFATGDLVSIDHDDFLYFHGRNSEMIKTSGANVSPREVEMSLLGLEGVLEAIVFGIEDPVKGEVVAAYVVARENHNVQPETLRERLRSELSPYKIPREIRLIAAEEVPRTGSQKVIKPRLKQKFMEDGVKSSEADRKND
jgi:acyl-CoA synthetase (AMP-forming)/AMP-acid ligase II